MKIINKLVGFTLAEILITLSIIGVIASMTIPSLVQDVQDAQLKTAWKQAYAVIEQASRRVRMDNAGSFKGMCGSTDNNLCFRNLFQKYMLFNKACDSSSLNPGNCWANNYYFLDGTSASGVYGSGVGAVFNNGNYIVFNHEYDICDPAVTRGRFCGFFMVDVNGNKGPNRFGKDIYGTYVYSDRLLPWGSPGSVSIWGAHNTDISTCSTTGLGCAAKFLYE